MPSTFGPYSPIRQAGELYFVSGQIGVDPAIKSAAADVTAQAEQALVNLEAVLANAGLGLGDVVKTTVFLTDMGDFAAMNEVYLKHFTSTPRPARSCVAVAELPRVADVPLKIEIEAIADQNLAEARALSDLP
jgi:2-iminobutanoate/2-iminopropanoate deaminase